MQPIRLISGFLTVGAWTMLSRVFGFARDILIAARLGDGPVAEAFVVAFTLPNMFRRFFAEGALNMAFIPIFSRKLEAGQGAEGFARDTFAALAALLIGLTLVAQLAMPWLVLALASGFADDPRLEMATLYGRLCFPYILFISLAALLSGVLNATGRFAAAAAAPVLLNMVLIAVMLAAAEAGQERLGLALSWAVPVAGVAQCALLWVAARRAGFTLRLRWPRYTPELGRLARIALPAMLAGGVLQINLIVGKQVASYFDGAIQYINLADRLYQLPLGVVAIAIGVVLLPDLSRKLEAGDTEGGRQAFNRATEFALLLTLPAALALIVVGQPIVSVLFERGAFDAEATANTALVTAIYGLGLPAFVLQKVLQPLFFARSDTVTPFRFAVVAMVINAVIAIGLAPVIGFQAAAWGTTVGGWATVALLWARSRTLGRAVEVDARLAGRVLRILAAALAMAAVLIGVEALLGDMLYTAGLRYGALAVLVLSGIAVYFAVADLIGATSLRDIRGVLRRG